jgi:hypothetical protein
MSLSFSCRQRVMFCMLVNSGNIKVMGSFLIVVWQIWFIVDWLHRMKSCFQSVVCWVWTLWVQGRKDNLTIDCGLAPTKLSPNRYKELHLWLLLFEWNNNESGWKSLRVEFKLVELFQFDHGSYWHDAWYEPFQTTKAFGRGTFVMFGRWSFLANQKKMSSKEGHHEWLLVLAYCTREWENSRGYGQAHKALGV